MGAFQDCLIQDFHQIQIVALTLVRRISVCSTSISNQIWLNDAEELAALAASCMEGPFPPLVPDVLLQFATGE